MTTPGTNLPTATPAAPAVTPPAVPPAVVPPAVTPPPATPPVTDPPALNAVDQMVAKFFPKTEPVVPQKDKKAVADPAPGEPAAVVLPGEPPAAAAPATEKRKPKKFVQPKPAEIDPGEVAAAAATAAVAAVEARRVAAAPVPTVAPAVSPEYQKNAEVFGKLEELYPEDYGGGKLAEKVGQVAKAKADYISTWKSQNPGQKFVEKDHATELEDFAIDIPEDHLDSAKIELAVDRRLKPINAKQEAIAVEAQRTEAQRALQPVATAASNRVFSEIAGILDEDIAKNAAAGEHAKVTEAFAANPQLRDDFSEIYQAWAPVAARAAELLSNHGLKLFNPNSQLDLSIVNGAIPAVIQKLAGTEDAEGKRFVGPEEFKRLSPSAQARSFTVDASHIQDHIAELAAGDARKLANRIKAYRNNGVKPGGEVKKVTPQTPAAKPEETAVPPTPAIAPVTYASSPGGGVGAGVAPVAGGGYNDIASKVSQRLF